jgi:hypothetical protein
VRRLPAIALVLPLGALLSACGTTASTSKFPAGPQREAAETVANFQGDVTDGEQKKICSEDLAASVVTRLGGKSGCEAAIKKQLTEVDNTELAIESVQAPSGSTTAVAKVQSVYEGKKKISTVNLVKEGSKWKISSLG